jgi:hypothetical protein
LKVGLTWDIYDLSWFLTESGIDISWKVDSEMGFNGCYEVPIATRFEGVRIICCSELRPDSCTTCEVRVKLQASLTSRHFFFPEIFQPPKFLIFVRTFYRIEHDSIHIWNHTIPATHQNATSLMFCRSGLRCLTSLGSSAFRITPQKPSQRRPTNSKPRFDSVRGCAPICNAYCQPRPRHFSQASPGGADQHRGVAIFLSSPPFSS